MSIVRILQKLTEALDALSTAELEQLASPDCRLEIRVLPDTPAVKPKRSKAGTTAAAPTTAPKTTPKAASKAASKARIEPATDSTGHEALKARLLALPSVEAANQVLQQELKKKPELQAFARFLGLPTPSKQTIGGLQALIIATTTARQLDRAAIDAVALR